MTVESNDAVSIATPTDWCHNLTPIFQPMRKNIETNRLLCALFPPRFGQVTGNCIGKEFSLVHRFVWSGCDWSD